MWGARLERQTTVMMETFCLEMDVRILVKWSVATCATLRTEVNLVICVKPSVVMV